MIISLIDNEKGEMLKYKIQDIVLTNHCAHKELNNHNIYSIHKKISIKTPCPL